MSTSLSNRLTAQPVATTSFASPKLKRSVPATTLEELLSLIQHDYTRLSATSNSDEKSAIAGHILHRNLSCLLDRSSSSTSAITPRAVADEVPSTAHRTVDRCYASVTQHHRALTFYEREVARLGTSAVRFVKLSDIPTVIPIRPYNDCSPKQRRYFWYAGQSFPELADKELHQLTPNIIFLVTGIAPLTISGWRIRGGEYTLYVYFRSERDLRLARALMNDRVQMSRNNAGEPGIVIYSRPGMALPDGEKAEAAHEPDLSFRLEAQRPSTRRKPVPPRYETVSATNNKASNSTSGSHTTPPNISPDNSFDFAVAQAEPRLILSDW